MVNEQPREPDVQGAGDTTIDKPIDPDRLLEAVESFGDVPDRDALRERVARTLHDLLGCEEAAVIEEVGCCSALAGPLRAALLEHARASGRPTSVSAGELLAIENDAAPGHVWAVAPLPSGFAARAVVARWRNGRAPRSRELRALGVVARWAGAAIDARDRRAALDAALQASDEFVTAAAHELRTPLTPLRLTVDRATRALESRNDPDRAKGALANVDEHVRRMTHLVDTLLEASRVARGELVLVRRDTDLSAVVEDVLARHAVQARQSGSEISVEAHERIVGRWDAQRLRESIAQLVANALKFGNGTPIRIGLSRCGDVARVAIRDEGLGVDAGDQERIFERFERAVSVRNFGGLGVGLWLAREIARAHGGDVTVASLPGDGATFTLELPIPGRRRHRAH